VARRQLRSGGPGRSVRSGRSGRSGPALSPGRSSTRVAAVLLVAFALVAVLLWWLQGRSAPAVDDSLQTKARHVIEVVDATGRSPDGYLGGRQFMNDERGGTTPLPRRGADGRVIVYHEYDVNPRHQGVDRGPQRLVMGSDGSAYVTPDHYVTWERLR